MTNLDQSGRGRLEPRPVSRPPVDPAAKRAFGRPDGVNGSFLGRGQSRDQGEYAPKDRPPDPVLAEAFGRPYPGGDSLQRHPTDAGALDAERDGAGDDADDPWRNPGAPVALGTPAVTQTAPAVASPPAGKLGVRDVLFGGKVSWIALVVLGIVALVIGIAGGVVGRKTAEVVEAFTTSKVTLETSNNGEPPQGEFARVAAAVADSVVTIEARTPTAAELIARATSAADPEVSVIGCATPSAPVMVMPAPGSETTVPSPATVMVVTCVRARRVTEKVVEPTDAVASLVATTESVELVAELASHRVGLVTACAAVCSAASRVLIVR